MHRKHIKLTLPLFLLVMQPPYCESQHQEQNLNLQVVDENGSFLSYDYHNAHKIHLDIQNSRKRQPPSPQHRRSKRSSSEENINIISSFTENYLRELYKNTHNNNQHISSSKTQQKSSSSKSRHKRSSSSSLQFSNNSSNNNPISDKSLTIYLNMTLFGEQHTKNFKIKIDKIPDDFI